MTAMTNLLPSFFTLRQRQGRVSALCITTQTLTLSNVSRSISINTTFRKECNYLRVHPSSASKLAAQAQCLCTNSSRQLLTSRVPCAVLGKSGSQGCQPAALVSLHCPLLEHGGPCLQHSGSHPPLSDVSSCLSTNWCWRDFEKTFFQYSHPQVTLKKCKQSL